METKIEIKIEAHRLHGMKFIKYCHLFFVSLLRFT